MKSKWGLAFYIGAPKKASLTFEQRLEGNQRQGAEENFKAE